MLIRSLAWTLALVAAGPVATAEDAAKKPLRAGYAGTSNDAHTRMLLNAGLNAHLWSSRIAPMFELEVDASGQVRRVGIDPEKDRSFRAYVQRSNELGLDLVVSTAYRKVHREQLEGLTEINHAVVQGPTRYLRVGERGVPSPLEEKYWMGQLLEEARYVAEVANENPNIRAFVFDLEAYAENVMWRHNSSFDDATFFAAIDLVAEREGEAVRTAAQRVDPDDRYDWLREHGLLEAYFAAQSELVTEMAVRFREAVREVNPDLALGFVYYEPNWMHDGWARGLGTPDQPCIVFSELEYHDGIGPSSRGLAQRLDDQGIQAWYMAGLQPEHFTPARFAAQADKGNRWHNGFWFFTSYSLWQPEPGKLWGPYLIRAASEQYVEALGEVHEPGYAPPADDGPTLLTGNAFYDGTAAPALPRVAYSRTPDVPFYDDPDGTKLFNGIENVGPGAVAWYAQPEEELVVDIDLQREVEIDRLRLRAGHSLMDHPMVESGTLTILTSTDGEHYYPYEKIKNPGHHRRGTFAFDDVGLRARYVRLVMQAEATPEYGVWAVSELVLWGSESPSP